MRGVQIVVLAIGLGLAGFGVYMAQAYVKQTEQAIAQVRQQQAIAEPIETVEVVVAARALRYGEPVLATDVRLMTWPAAAVPPGAFTELAGLLTDPARPRIALRAMEPMEPVLAIKVSEPGARAGIAAQLSPGMRAFTIRVDSSSGISGTMRPSDLVDIYWTGRAGQDGEVTRLLGSAMKVIALDENADQDRTLAGIPRTVTIEATPEMVATLAQGQSTGRLTLSVVGLDDTTRISNFQVDSRQLLGVQAAQAVPEVARCSIRTRRGSEVVTMEIPCTH